MLFSATLIVDAVFPVLLEDQGLKYAYLFPVLLRMLLKDTGYSLGTNSWHLIFRVLYLFS